MIKGEEEMDSKESILIVDDDESICKTLKLIFNKKGYKIDTAGTGREAIDKIKGIFFNLVLLDIKLPDMEGVELLIPLKKINPDVVVIMITGYASLETAVQTMSKGASAYITKPLKMDELLHTVKKVLEKQFLIIEKRRAEKALRESEERLKAFMDSATEGFILYDSALNIVVVNKVALQMTGVSKEKLIGKNILEIEPDIKESGIYDKYLEVIKTGKPFFIDDLIPHLRFGDIHLSIRAFKVGDGLGIIATDITEHKKAEEKLKKTKEKYQNMIENIKSGAYEVDLKGNLTFLNNYLSKYLGYPKDDLIGKNYAEVIADKNMVKDMFKIYNQVYRNEIPQGSLFETQFLRYDGEKRFFEGSISLKHDSQGRIVGFYGLTHDITERKKAEEKLKKTKEKYQNMIENIKSGAYEVDLKGNLTFLNNYLSKYLGYPKDDLIGKNYAEVIADKNMVKDMFKIYNQVYRNEIPQGSLFETQFLRYDGKKRFIESSIYLKLDSQGRIVGFSGLTHDITERKKAEDLRKKFTEKLENEVKIRTKELEVALELKERLLNEIIKGSQFKTEFLANMSHELRTPLNAIIGFSDILLEQSYGQINEQQLEFLEDILSSSDHLLDLINRILDISKIEAGQIKLNITRVSLNNLINQISSTIRPLYSKKGLNFKVKGLKTEKEIYVDPIRFKEILYNLLSNAIKFTIQGEIFLIIQENDDYWVFKVKDTGIGIALKDFDLIFKEFRRIDSPYVQSTSGTGLGLPLTKKLVNLHGGEITFSSNLGVGTTFTFTILKDLGGKE